MIIRSDLDINEIPSALVCCYLADDPRELIVVGSQLISSVKENHKGSMRTHRGRIRIFDMMRVKDNSCTSNS